MHIILLASAFNSLTQAFFVTLRDQGHQVGVVLAVNEQQILQELERYTVEIIIAPFLMQYLSKNIYERYPTYIVHPGPIGDRGPDALEYALIEPTRIWGVVILKANATYDGGDIYAQELFKVRQTSKASLYRQEVVRAALKVLEAFLVHVRTDTCKKQICNPLHTKWTQAMRAIHWSEATTQMIIDTVNRSDSTPGVFDTIRGVPCYLFGAWKESVLRGNVKEVLAKRNGAICLGTVDGAVWLSHLQEPNRFKLPATYVLKERLQGIKEHRIPLIFDKSYDTFHEISMQRRDDVVYLHFNFHNGAMSSEQCIRLKYAVEHLKQECKVLVLMGGADFFSNGIHLNILEESEKPGEDGWSNINAMNDLIASLLYADEIVTVASLHNNAGAGGVFLALACDAVVARDGVVLNAHYKTMGLSGSEYHSYTLSKRVGVSQAKKILDEAVPVSASYAKTINMIDALFADEEYFDSLHVFSSRLYTREMIWKKQEYLEEHRERIEMLKQEELHRMYPEFWDQQSHFHTLRRKFVYKICPTQTPKHLVARELYYA